MEDTAFYRYGRLLSRNDVGFDPAGSAAPPPNSIAACSERAADFPHAMLATATHDHKRGEDVRARLAVLSEMAGEWTRAVAALDRALRARCAAARTMPMPQRGDIAMLLQTIVGAWPLGLDVDERGRPAAFAKRSRMAAERHCARPS